jgi:hypothetical protein
MAKALDPDIETHEAFRLANEKCAEQEKRNCKIEAFERIDFEAADEASFPYP